MRWIKQRWIDLLFLFGIRKEEDWCISCRNETKMFDDDYGSPHGLCGGCGGARAEAMAEMREDR